MLLIRRQGLTPTDLKVLEGEEERKNTLGLHTCKCYRFPHRENDHSNDHRKPWSVAIATLYWEIIARGWLPWQHSGDLGPPGLSGKTMNPVCSL